jgi:hypothetical protein
MLQFRAFIFSRKMTIKYALTSLHQTFGKKFQNPEKIYGFLAELKLSILNHKEKFRSRYPLPKDIEQVFKLTI